jgi:hypothetical protein
VLECHVTGDLIFAAPPDAIHRRPAPPDAIPNGPTPPDAVPAARNAGSTWMGTGTTSLRELRLWRIQPPPPSTSALFPRRHRICSRPPTWISIPRLTTSHSLTPTRGTYSLMEVTVMMEHLLAVAADHALVSSCLLARVELQAEVAVEAEVAAPIP